MAGLANTQYGYFPGSLGVGVSAPSSPLDVYSNTALAVPGVDVHLDNASSTGAAWKVTNDGTGGLVQFNAQTLAVVLSDAGTAASTEAGWIEFKTTAGAVVGYARLYSSK